MQEVTKEGKVSTVAFYFTTSGQVSPIKRRRINGMDKKVSNDYFIKYDNCNVYNFF